MLRELKTKNSMDIVEFVLITIVMALCTFVGYSICKMRYLKLTSTLIDSLDVGDPQFEGKIRTIEALMK